jgi:ubiquinone/menaquinone biosynthesis C-methylase UbiE
LSNHKHSHGQQNYLMENEEEAKRLELKTDKEAVIRQASWAGIGPGMRVLDVGCGTGITTAALAELVGERGKVTGLDFSEERLTMARELYASDRVDFVLHNIHAHYNADEPYDAIWSRFFLEYFRQDQQQIVANSVASLRPGGIACFADLDNNSLGHCGLSARLQQTLEEIAAHLEQDFNFDPCAGRRLYGHLYSLGFRELACMGEMHHLIYGVTSEEEQYNWLRKLEVVAQKSGCSFSAFGGGYEEFCTEYKAFLNDPLRFTYTPLILARGIKPSQEPC